MRDGSNVIAFTLALKFAFIVIQLVAISPWSYYVIRKLLLSCNAWKLLPGNVLMHQLGPYQIRWRVAHEARRS